MEKITAIITCFNEEHNIQLAIDSCEFADELIVVDSFSEDKTLDIIKKHSHIKLLQREYLSCANQKNWTIPQAQHPWVFILDADERTTPELIEEMKNTAMTGDCDAYWIGRDNYFMGEKLNHVWKGDAVIRLFRRDKCRYEDKFVHGEIKAEGKVGRLKGRLIHDTYSGKGLDSHLQKAERYTTFAALDRVNKISKVTYYHLLIKPFFGFLKRYILNRGFLDGKVGFIISCMGAWNIFVRNVKIKRMHEGESFSSK